jgi:outer membrane protein assembly factor BamB
MVLTACWPTPGAGPDRRSFNPSEQSLTAETVGDLTEGFRAPLPDGAGPPVVTGDGLFVQTGDSIAAFEPATGTLRWSRNLSDPGFEPLTTVSDPFLALGRGQVLVTSFRFFQGGRGTLFTLDTATGGVEGQVPSEELFSLRGTALGQLGRHVNPDFDFTQLEVTDIDGTTVWGGFVSVRTRGVVTLGQGTLFVTDGGAVAAYDTTTPCPPGPPGFDPVCMSRWSLRLGTAVTPVVIGDGGTVYIGEAAGDVYALRADTGGVRFHVEVGSSVRHPPALAYGTLFVASADGRLSAAPAGGCGATSCEPSWTTAAGTETTTQPAVAGGVVYVGSADGTVRAYDADGCGQATCDPIWTADAGGPVTGGLAVSGGRLYVSTADAVVGYAQPG